MSSDDSNPISKIADQAMNLATQYASMGLVSYEDGKLGKGVTTRAADETLGEVTGRNAGRAAMSETRIKLAADQAQKTQELKDEALKTQQNDINASSGAAGIRATAAATKNNALGRSNPSKDFLGL